MSTSLTRRRRDPAERRNIGVEPIGPDRPQPDARGQPPATQQPRRQHERLEDRPVFGRHPAENFKDLVELSGQALPQSGQELSRVRRSGR
jgi:hypothetical protein